MKTVIQFAVLGLGGGAVYALLAQGMVLVYRGSGVLNLSHGSFAMIGAFLFIQLHQTDRWSFAPACLVVVATGAGLGLATHFGLMRPLRGASSLSRVIATLGVLLTLQAIGVLIWGSNPLLLTPFLPQQVFTIGGIAIPADQMILLGCAVLVMALFWAMYRFTRSSCDARGGWKSPRDSGARALS